MKKKLLNYQTKIILMIHPTQRKRMDNQKVKTKITIIIIEQTQKTKTNLMKRTRKLLNQKKKRKLN